MINTIIYRKVILGGVTSMKDKVLKNMELDDFLKETKFKTFKPLFISILVGLLGLTVGLILLKFNWTVSLLPA
jgi:hypothetical protein